ncbi:MAG TPA: YtxH domain-containing protein [Spirosoma sp.]|nr:YtxH domain-containing protein [Spirosoma sp.]
MRSTRDFLTGIITGVVIGILTAPRSGKETRDKLTEEVDKRSSDLKDKWESGSLKDQWDKGVTKAKDGFEQAKSQVSQYADKAKDQFEQLKGQAQGALDKDKAKSQYNDTVDDVADQAQSGVDNARDSFQVN